jgi:hypothetical protein
MLDRASLASDTLALCPNYANFGIYVLHGDKDDNVPVDQARTMRKLLGEFHSDFEYYERPGAGHWWGSECCDWAPLTAFLARHELPEQDAVRRIDFVTASPGVSARFHWATIECQTKTYRLSAVHLSYDPEKRRVSGTTENVARLALELPRTNGKLSEVELDGQKLAVDPNAKEAGRVSLARDGSKWSIVAAASPALKGPHRYGTFKDAFRNRFQLVYGTAGSAEENAWALAKARFDAESFWYRGNGAMDVIPDTEFDAAIDRDRNVVLYGNAESNRAWDALLKDSPVQVRRGSVRVGERAERGDDLASLFIRPRPGSDRASVGVVSGTGMVGMRLTDRIPYFVSGVGLPDCTILGAESLTNGASGLRAAGFFGPDWSVANGEFAWRD